jgi:hypothetical protein
VSATSPTPSPVKPKPRVKRVDRKQVRLVIVDPERGVEEDHRVRAIWDLLGKLDLSRFYGGIKAVEGRAGREHSGPAGADRALVVRPQPGHPRGAFLGRGVELRAGLPMVAGLGPHQLSHPERFRQRLRGRLG